MCSTSKVKTVPHHGVSASKPRLVFQTVGSSKFGSTTSTAMRALPVPGLLAVPDGTWPYGSAMKLAAVV